MEGPFKPTWESLENFQVPQWYIDGKFGIFIHWGVYSVPAFGNEWYPRNMYKQGTREFEHHIKTYGPQKDFGYKDFIPMFTAENFDADRWADLFLKSGAKFVVPVAEHHDGFAMYDCSYTKWNAVKMGPKRDIIGELANAVRKRYLVFGISYHRAEHWWFFHEGMKFDSDVRDSRFIDFYGPAQPETTQPNEEFLEDWLNRLYELVDKYRPQIVWFDWWIEQPAFEPYLRRFAAYYYNRGFQWNKGVAINYKNEAFPRKTAVLDIERGQLDDIDPYFWQTDTSVSKNSWGYIKDHDYKTTEWIICDLVDIVSKNGALLLNIGPKPDGTIPEPEEKMLLEIGQWLLVNGEAIYGTKPWKVYGEGPTKVIAGSFADTKRSEFTGKDIRFTTKGNNLYAIVLGKPENNEVLIQSLGSNLRLFNRDITEVKILGMDERIQWTREESGLRVRIPERLDTRFPFAIKIIL